MTSRRVGLLLVSSIVIVVLAAWLSSNRPTTRATLAGQPALQGFGTGTVNAKLFVPELVRAASGG